MIENTALQTILETAADISLVAEIYDADATPTSDGFDPDDAMACYAAVDGITFMGVEYQQLVTNFGGIRRTISPDVNTARVTFSNTTREIADFEFTHGFEGLILVIRTISRSQSDTLAKSKIEFVGRCEKPTSGDKDSLTVSANFILGSIDVSIPRRNFGPDDPEGRAPTDPEFEGFRFMPQTGTITYQRKEKKGGFLGWWNKKWVRHTLQYSSYSNLDANKYVPEVLGRAQIQSVLIAGLDVGTALQTVNAFCEGEIEDFQNVRSLDANFPLSVTNYSEHLGKVGALNGNTPGYVGDAYYSRTALVRVDVTNSAVEDTDEAPDIVGVVLGRLMKIPDGSNVWAGSEWTDNAAAHIRWVLTDPYYYNLDEDWIDDDHFGDSYWFNEEFIFNSEVSDFTFVDEG